MNTSKNFKTVLLKNKEGQPLRFFQTESAALILAQNKNTKRIELFDINSDYEETHQVLQKIYLEEKWDANKGLTLKGLGSLTYYHHGEQIDLDPQFPEEKNPEFPIFFKWSGSTHGIILGILVLFAFFVKKPANTISSKPVDTLVTIKLDDVKPKEETPTVSKKLPELPPQSATKDVMAKNSHIKVVPRTNKQKSLLVKKVPVSKYASRSHNGPTNFQRMGTLGAISNALKGSRTGRGSGLRLEGAAGYGGGMGRGAGVGRGNGTMGHGNDSGGGYQQALYGKGLIAGQVGNGEGGFGSGWGNGRRGSGSYGTKGKGGGHEGYGNSKIGGGSGPAVFAYPVQEETVVEGGLDRDAVDLVVMRNLGQITYCYELGLQKQSKLRGRVLVDFTINGKGLVSAQSISTSSLHSPSVENCMLSKIKTWKFPRPVGGVNVEVNYPFALQRVSQN